MGKNEKNEKIVKAAQEIQEQINRQLALISTPLTPYKTGKISGDCKKEGKVNKLNNLDKRKIKR